MISGSGNYQEPECGSRLPLTNGTAQADHAVVYALITTIGTPQLSHSFHTNSTQPSLHMKPPNNQWIIDSGASRHLTSDGSVFVALQPLEEHIAFTVGNGNTIKAIGIGGIYLEFPFGTKLSIDALYVPGIERSLLSVSQLNDILALTFQNRYCYSDTEMIGILRDGLYELIATPVPMRLPLSHTYIPDQSLSTTGQSAVFPTTVSSLDLWHLRLGHHLAI